MQQILMDVHVHVLTFPRLEGISSNFSHTLHDCRYIPLCITVTFSRYSCLYSTSVFCKF